MPFFCDGNPIGAFFKKDCTETRKSIHIPHPLSHQRISLKLCDFRRYLFSVGFICFVVRCGTITQRN